MRFRKNSAFPVNARRPFIGVSDGGHLHLVTLNAYHEQVQYFALAAQGSVVGPVTRLPLLRADSIGSHANSTLIVGQLEQGGRSLLRLQAGEILSQGNVAIERSLMVSPKLAVAEEHSFLVWATDSKESALCVARVEADSLGETQQFQFEDLIFDLRAVASRRTLTVACIHGHNETTLELILTADDHIAERVTIKDATRPVAPSLVLVGSELILFWLTKPEHELRAQAL